MSLFCYVTQQLQKDATSHGIALSKIEGFKAEVEARQSLAGFDHFPPPCLTKKKIFGFNYRLIAAEKLVGEHLVVVFLRLVIRGGNEYTDFLRDPPTWAGRYYDAELSQATLDQWVAERTHVDPPAPPPALSNAEQTFLWLGGSGHDHDDMIICETYEWVDSVAESRINDRLIRLPDLIVKALDGPPGEVQRLVARNDDRLAIQAYVVPQTRQCVLLRAGYGDLDDRVRATETEWSARLRDAGTDQVLRLCRRSYPSIICYDEDLWIAVERDPQANMALSPEEAEILRSANSLDPQTATFPLFINGRAGSGKSTLLQYLFAQCFLRWAQHFREQETADSCPLYFASSGELLKVAKDVVNRLLRGNYEHLLAEYDLAEADLVRLNECFQDTLRFLRLAAGADAETRFPLSKHVTYAKFRRLWMNRFGREQRALHDYGPQISWHVIRGLIKGMSVDELLGKEDYEELPEDEKTVSKSVYESVFDRVWLGWYEPLCRSGEAWDTQDLVRFLLDENRLPGSHVAVFCDEAQDFTRLEIEAIYRCSLFSDRLIDFQSVKRIPFVFAGDPFQTLNPTGFRWESVRAAFTERILRSLYRFSSRTEVPQLPYRELTFNYRSSARIVHLCNSIQAIRACLFGHRSLRPQHTWQVEGDSAAPVFFEKGDSQLEEALRNQPDLVLIVPCEEGEEVEFVARDDYLRGLVQTDDDGTPRNVLSAARAKGLEFLRVALYGWSYREEASALARLVRSPGKQEITVDERLGLEYFLNNLYVAASRARRRLFVIDEKASHDTLWWFAVDEQHLQTILQDLPGRGEWQNNTGFLVQGVPESFAEDQDDPRTIAERFESEGLTKQDSYFLKQASQHYRIAGDERKAYVCRAMADLFDEKYKESGQSFEKASEIDQSIDAYWRGKLCRDIVECATRHPEVAKHPRCRMARFLEATTRTPRECKSLLEQLTESAKVSDDIRRDMRSALWKAAIDDALRKTLGEKGKSASGVNQEEAAELADALSDLEVNGVKLEANVMARVLFAAGRFDAVLERIGEDDGSELYRDARAHQLIAISGRGDHKFSRGESQAVADFHYRQGEFEQASRHYAEILDATRLLDCTRRVILDHRGAARTVIERTLAALIEMGEWANVVSLVTAGQPASLSWSKAERAAVQEIVRDNQLDFVAVVPALARSNKLSQADAKSQHRVSEYLAERLIRGSNLVWRETVTMHVAGAAIERAGKDLDALKFYEQWRDAATSSDDRAYTERRWVVCKLRQADREERDGRTKKASGYRQDAESVMTKYGWTEDDVPDVFPEMSGTTPNIPTEASIKRAHVDPEKVPKRQVAIPTRATVPDSGGRLGALSYRVIAAKGWVNIESDDGLRARVHISERSLTSDDLDVRKLEEGDFECADWGLRVRWLSDSTIQFVLGDTTCDVSIDVE
jgi:hypothetical protein